MTRVTLLSSCLYPFPPPPTLLSDSRGDTGVENVWGLNSSPIFPGVGSSFSADLGCRSISPDFQGEHKWTFRCWLLIVEMYASQLGPTTGQWPFWLSCSRTRYSHKEPGRLTATAAVPPASPAAIQKVAKLEPRSLPAFSCSKKKAPQASRSQDGQMQHSVSLLCSPKVPRLFWTPSSMPICVLKFPFLACLS